MKYYVSLTETLNKVVSVEADNAEEARKKVSEAYDNLDCTLTWDDYVDGSIEIAVEVDQDFHREREEEWGARYQQIK